MTYPQFVLKNVLRNKRRTGLTVLSIGFSLFLLIALTTFLDTLLNPPVSDDSALRLAVKRSTSLADLMPISYLDKLKRVPHVVRAMPLQWFGGIYKEPKNFFANFATDPNEMWNMFPELVLSEEAKRRFATERTAAVAGTGLMDRFGWKVDDRVTLQGTFFPVDLEFTIVGIYDHEIDKNNFYFRFDYFNEAMDTPNEVGTFWLMADDAKSIPAIIDTVDAMFRNSAAETKTETEKSFMLSFISMLGNVRVMIGSIMLVVIFTMSLVSASTMAMTIRERMREIAILKAVGYRPPLILSLILGEAVFIGILGFLFGSLLAASMNFFDLYSLTQGFIQAFSPGWHIYGRALLTGVGIGVLSGLFPALRASHLTITQALRELE